MTTVKIKGSTLDYLRAGRPDSDIEHFGSTAMPKGLPRIVCADGFSLSVQAGEYLYSTPRENHGPWSAVEVGFPSARPEPWDEWKQYVEDELDPTGTVYSYVPLSMVEALVALHGGTPKGQGEFDR